MGFVVNSGKSSALKDYQRANYTDKLASAILAANPALEGRLDSHRYVSARVGDPMADLIKSFRLEGELSDRAMNQLHNAQLRRRYLMLATISPIDQVIELQADVKRRSGPANYNLEDYEDVRLHTVRLKAVRVQTYDLVTRRRIQDETYSSDDHDTMLATEVEGRRYVGNSLLAAIANGFSNRIKYGGDLDHPAAPASDRTLDHLWRQIAANLPRSLQQ